MENKTELGSEFNLSLNNLRTVKNNLFQYMSKYRVQWYDYGRSAIRHIPVPKNKIILLPEFICESVIDCFDRSMVNFYKVVDNFDIDIEDLTGKVNSDVGIIYVAYYFGYIQNEDTMQKIKKIAHKYGVTIVEDTTQSLFSEHEIIGDYAVASIRKWMPIPMGGMLYTNRGGYLPSQESCDISADNTKAYGMILKDMFLNMNYDTNEKYREIFAETEEKIDEQSDVYLMSDFSRYLIGCVDINQLIEKRRKNSQRLLMGLEEIGVSSARGFKRNECPLVVPVRVRNRDEFRKYLIDNRIYCAVHWPFDGFKAHERKHAVDNAESLISLPVDQRYGDEEIDYMIDVIRRYGGGLSY